MTLHVLDRTVVEEEGEGDAVVCVHGLGATKASFFDAATPSYRRSAINAP